MRLMKPLRFPPIFPPASRAIRRLCLPKKPGLTKVIDPLGGSYYVEALTTALVDQAWKIIGQVDEAGGMTKAVDSGMPKQLIEEAAAARQARVDKGEDVIVGVNKYALDDEEHLDTLEVDNAKVREGQIARIKANKAGRDEDACQAALTALSDGAKNDGNLLALAVDAARARATLGEISAAMETEFGRYRTTPTPVKGIYGAAYSEDDRYAQVLNGVAAVKQRLGRAPKLLVAKMGAGRA